MPDELSPVDQANVAPGVIEVAVNVRDVVTQVSVPPAPALASGGVVFWFTTTEDIAVQPFAGSVTVTVYVLGAFTEVPAVTAPSDHKKVALGVTEEAVKFIDVVVQVNVPPEPALASGGVMSWFTTKDEEAVQPFAGSVTVTV